MPIIVSGPGIFRHSAVAERFGVIFRLGTRIPAATDYWIETHDAVRLSHEPAVPTILFDDEEVLLVGTYRAGRASAWWTERLLKAIVVAKDASGGWREITSMSHKRSAEGTVLSGRVRLRPGPMELRVKVGDRLRRKGYYELPSLHTRVLPAPAILTFIAMGGSGSGGSSGTDSGSSSSSSEGSSSGSSGSSSGSSGSSSGSSGSSSGSGTNPRSSSGSSSGGSGQDLLERNGITVDASRCAVDPTLIAQLIEARNIQCNDLCAECTNFIEFLGLRLLDEEDLATRMESLRHKVDASEPDFCSLRVNPAGVSNRIVLGKWENSEHEHFRPPHIKTFESILDEYAASGGGSLVIVANSLAGAKLAATVKDHWRWGQSISVVLFVSWDATHLGGGIPSLGPRPDRIVNFFQQGNPAWWQNGSPIAEADVEFDLTGCLSHNAVVRSVFVHQTTTEEVRTAVARIRALARDQ